MKTLILTLLLMAAPAMAHDEPSAETKAQLDRIEQQANYEAMRARQRAFMERARQEAQRHQARGMCAVNGSC